MKNIILQQLPQNLYIKIIDLKGRVKTFKVIGSRTAITAQQIATKITHFAFKVILQYQKERKKE